MLLNGLIVLTAFSLGRRFPGGRKSGALDCGFRWLKNNSYDFPGYAKFSGKRSSEE